MHLQHNIPQHSTDPSVFPINHESNALLSLLPITVMSTTSSSKTLAGDLIQSSDVTWTEGDELGLLRAVLEIAMEPAEAFDPRVSPFARIERNLGGGERFTRAEILAKVRELRRRYEERAARPMTGELGGAHINENGIAEEVFDICHSVWGAVGMNKKKKVRINKLLSVASDKFEKDLQTKNHFLAIISSSSGEKYRLKCCQSRPSCPNGFCSSNSASNFCTKKSGKLTENIDLMALRQSSNLVWTALNDANQKHCEQHSELIDMSIQYQELKGQQNRYQESLMVMSNETVAQPFISGMKDFLSHEPETPELAIEANGRALLAESSRRVAKKRVRWAIEVCTEGKGRARAPSSFSLCNDVIRQSDVNSESLDMNKPVCDPVRHEYPKLQITAELHQNLDLDTESFQPSYRPVTGFHDLSHFIFDRESEYLFVSAQQ